MDNTNQTPADAAATKPQPKVTFEKAVEVIKPKVEALLTETLAGFELTATDKGSRKRIFGALVSVAATFMLNNKGETNLSPSSLSRRAYRAINSILPTGYTTPTSSIADEDGDVEADDDTGDNDSDE
jgi:hypothetical protein